MHKYDALLDTRKNLNFDNELYAVYYCSIVVSLCLKLVPHTGLKIRDESA